MFMSEIFSRTDFEKAPRKYQQNKHFLLLNISFLTSKG